MTIVTPSVASRSATAAPMPRDAPVTIATLLVLSVILQSPVVISGNAFRGEKDSHFWRALTALRSSRGVGLERDDFSSNRHPALSFCLTMICAQTLRGCREGKPVPTPRVVARGHAFPDPALAQTAGRGDAFAGQPRGVVGCQENGHARDVFGLAETAQRCHADNLLFEIAAEDAGRDKSLRRGTSGRDGVDTNFARAQFLRQAARDRVDRALGCGIDDRVRRRVQACDR